MTIFIDSNVPMYVAGRDHPNRPACVRFLERVRSGAVEAVTSTEVLQEILYRYVSLNRRDLAQKVYDLFVQICPTVLPVAIADTDLARTLLGKEHTLGARDALHVAVMMNHGIRKIATWDADFDGIKHIQRVALTSIA